MDRTKWEWSRRCGLLVIRLQSVMILAGSDRRFFQRTSLLALTGSILFSSLGCQTTGPQTIARDRVEYGESIAEAWMRQYLLNIVKIRYQSPPVFVDVASVVAGYTFDRSVSADVGLNRDGFSSLGLGGGGRLIDRPTITYHPIKGSAFVQRFVTPIRPETMFFMVEAGWPADVILMTGVSAINGLRNRRFSMAGGTEGDERFFRVADLFRKIQVADGLDMRILRETDDDFTALLILHADFVPERILENITELRDLLDLDPEINEYELVFGSVARDRAEIAVHTRSPLQILATLAAEIEVPESHIEEGRTVPDLQRGEPKLLTVHCTREQPRDALVAIEYFGHWFWIDNRDIESKRVFSLLMLLLGLADTAEPEALPLLTIPTQ